MAVRFDWNWELGAFLVFASALVILTLIDLRTKRLPREIIYTAALVAAPFLVAGAFVDDELRRVTWAAVCAVAAVAVFAIVYVVSRGGMGDGDVRLAGLIGLHLGWIGPAHAVVGLFAGFLFGAVAGIAALLSGAGRKKALPFGPFMAMGAIAAALFGRPIVRAWLGT
jgi:leader peptidase (prepilin peptidase)/N-methyltransferase